MANKNTRRHQIAAHKANRSSSADGRVTFFTRVKYSSEGTRHEVETGVHYHGMSAYNASRIQKRKYMNSPRKPEEQTDARVKR